MRCTSIFPSTESFVFFCHIDALVRLGSLLPAWEVRGPCSPEMDGADALFRPIGRRQAACHPGVRIRDLVLQVRRVLDHARARLGQGVSRAACWRGSACSSSSPKGWLAPSDRRAAAASGAAMRRCHGGGGHLRCGGGAGRCALESVGRSGAKP